MKRIYWTKVNGANDRFGENNKYVRGRINGFMEVLCGRNYTPTFLDPENGDAHISVKCTEEQYQVFRKLVEERYPGLCEFDVEFEA